MSERVDKLMNRLSDWFCQEISGNISKAAADIVRAQKDGVGAYSIGGIILSGCGIGWILKEQEKLRKKVQIGKVTLPITYGDTLALKVLGVIAIIFIVILGIGCLQGWLEWQS